MEVENHLGEVEIIIKGKAASALQCLQIMTGKQQPVDVVISALRLYEWALGQQTVGATIIVRSPGENMSDDCEELEIENYIQDQKTASFYFNGRDIVEGKRLVERVATP